MLKENESYFELEKEENKTQTVVINHGNGFESDALPDFDLPIVVQGMTKSRIAEIVKASHEHLMDRGNVLEVAEAVKVADEFVKQYRNDAFVAMVHDELTKWGGKKTMPSGAVLEVMETGVKFDYSQNPEWCGLDAQIKELTERKKALEEKLKTIGQGKEIVDTETGEMFIGAAKTSKSNYKISLAK